VFEEKDDWPAGVYSIVKIELEELGHSTHLVLVHTGFPEGADEHLPPGWTTNYWEPLAKFLGGA
jgi:Activator of Hsp90 ATPase homolog 1-like protein